MKLHLKDKSLFRRAVYGRALKVPLKTLINLDPMEDESPQQTSQDHKVGLRSNDESFLDAGQTQRLSNPPPSHEEETASKAPVHSGPDLRWTEIVNKVQELSNTLDALETTNKQRKGEVKRLEESLQMMEQHYVSIFELQQALIGSQQAELERQKYGIEPYPYVYHGAFGHGRGANGLPEPLQPTTEATACASRHTPPLDTQQVNLPGGRCLDSPSASGNFGSALAASPDEFLGDVQDDPYRPMEEALGGYDGAKD